MSEKVKSPHDPRTYKEYKVEFLIKGGKFFFDPKNPEFETKHQTKRGTVRISEHDAAINNQQVMQSKKFYELEDEALFMGKPYGEWTVKALKQLAEDKGIDLESTKKADIINEINSHE